MAQTMPNPLRDPQPIRPRKAPLPFPLNIWQSAVGRKWIMAITGIGLIGFVIALELEMHDLEEHPGVALEAIVERKGRHRGRVRLRARGRRLRARGSSG